MQLSVLFDGKRCWNQKYAKVHLFLWMMSMRRVTGTKCVINKLGRSICASVAIITATAPLLESDRPAPSKRRRIWMPVDRAGMKPIDHQCSCHHCRSWNIYDEVNNPCSGQEKKASAMDMFLLMIFPLSSSEISL